MDEDLRKEINDLIYKLREGDSKAWNNLYMLYKRRVKLFVQKNPWLNEIKDTELLIENIMLKLHEWFLKHEIEKSDTSVVYYLVKRECANQGKKDKREPSYGIDRRSYYRSKNQNPSEHGLQNDNLKRIKGSCPKKREGIKNDWTMRVNFRLILSKCLKQLSERQVSVLDYYIFKGYTFKEIGILINKTDVTAFNEYNKGLKKLLRCFHEHGIYSIGELNEL
jgi:DNA-directed RNA polymerase specialized sigma24 family protein